MLNFPMNYLPVKNSKDPLLLDHMVHGISLHTLIIVWKSVPKTAKTVETLLDDVLATDF